MNLLIRKASVCWSGGSNGGSRMVTPPRSKQKQNGFTGGIRFEAGSGTDPAELIAAAHASSFSTALATELGSKISAAGEIVTTATVTAEQGAGGWTIMDIHLNVAAKVPKVTQARFIDATVRAKTNCLVSRLLRAHISLTARLEKWIAP